MSQVQIYLMPGSLITITMMFNFNLMRTLTTKLRDFKTEINEYDVLSKKLLKYCNRKIENSPEPILHIPTHMIKLHLNIDFDDRKLRRLISIVCDNNRHIAQLGRYVIIIKH